MHLIPNWHQAHRMHSVQIAAFWALLNGAVIGLSAFADVFNPWIFLGLNTAGYGLIGVARVTHQPGLSDE